MKPLITVVAPMYNEEKVVVPYCEAVLAVWKNIEDQYNLELLLVNDGSDDRTLDEMSKIHTEHPQQIGIVNLTRNFGLEGAVDAGLQVATGDAVVVMDADLQDPPEVILELINKWEQGYDVVSAKRVKRTSDNLFKRASAALFYYVQDKLSGKLKLERNAANYRLLSRKAVDTLLSFPEVNRSFRVLVPFAGMKSAYVEYERDKRFAGKTKYNLSSMVHYALDSLTGVSTEILRKISWFVPAFALASMVALAGMIFGNRELFAVIFLISISDMLIFAGLSVIAEYIGQIMVEVKGRPTSIIYDVIPSGNARKGD